MRSYRRILSLIDLTENGESVARRGLQLARMYNAALALSVIVDYAPGFECDHVPFRTPQQMRDAIVRDVKSKLDSIIATIGAGGAEAVVVAAFDGAGDGGNRQGLAAGPGAGGFPRTPDPAAARRIRLRRQRQAALRCAHGAGGAAEPGRTAGQRVVRIVLTRMSVRRLILMLVLGVAAALAGAFPAGATTPQEAVEIASLAQSGNEGAQLLLGLIYLHGDAGYPRDEQQAAHWLSRAAEAGNAYAQMTVGDLYAAGTGVPRDLRQAALWRNRAAEQGNAAAQAKLGEMFLKGEGVSRDDRQAERWLAHAADQGDAHAQYLLGRMYRNGCAETQDLDRGRDWLERAAAQGHSAALEALELARELGEGALEVYREQGDVLMRRAEDGDIEAQYELGLRYEKGAGGFRRDAGKAVRWLTAAADRGHRGAMRSLAQIFENGADGIPADAARAAALRKRASETPCIGGDGA